MRIFERLYLRLTFGKMVDLNLDVLDQVCDLLTKISKPDKPFDWRDEAYWPDDKEGMSTVSQFFAVGNAINFRYWWINDRGSYKYCEGPKGGSCQRGAYYMWRALRLCQINNMVPILDARKLSRISFDEVKRIFRNDQGHDIMPALEERQRNWRDLGHKLLEYWDGQFYNMVKETRGSLFDFVRYSREFRAFDDPLCKMAMVNAIMHHGRGIVNFDKPVFPGIDYQLLKQQMRIGILVPKRNLSKKLTQKKLLGHKEARELRNAGLSSFLYIMQKTSISGDVIDNIWWNNRKICTDLTPLCEKCLLKDVCKKKIQYGIPLEMTRYY